MAIRPGSKMENFTISDVLKATKGRLVKGDSDSIVRDISTDSRTLKEGDLFVALIGERFDGHDFIPQALNRGAMGAVVSRGDLDGLPVKTLVAVEDTTRALGDIAGLYRRGFNIPVVGITGSNGKTTTKDMMASVLSQKCRVLKSEGNFNNAIGVPLTLFKLSRSHEVAVIEMGVSIPGEMARLVEIAQPDVAVVTNVSSTHLEFFGSVDRVAAEKGILVKSASSAVLNADDPYVAKMYDTVNGTVISFGINNSADVSAVEIGQDHDDRPEFTLVIQSPLYEKARIRLPSIGKHNIYNALAAASAGVLFRMEIDDIREALESYQPVPMRMQKLIVGGSTIIDDTYNSNPVSLKAAVDFLSNIECDGKRIAVIGDMLELGQHSDRLHKEAGNFIASCPIHTLMTVGDKAALLAEAALEADMADDRVIICRTNADAVANLHKILREGDAVLIKGSRGMKMEEIVEAIQA